MSVETSTTNTNNVLNKLQYHVNKLNIYKNFKLFDNHISNICESIYYNYTLNNTHHHILSHYKIHNNITGHNLCFEYLNNNSNNDTIAIFLSFTMNSDEFSPVIKYIREFTNFNILIVNRVNMHCPYKNQHFILGNEDDAYCIISEFYKIIKKTEMDKGKIYGLGVSLGGNYLTRIMSKYNNLFYSSSIICPVVSLDSCIFGKNDKEPIDYFVFLSLYNSLIERAFPYYKHSLLDRILLAEKIRQSYIKLYNTSGISLDNYTNLENHISNIITPCIYFINNTDPICNYSREFINKCKSNKNISLIHTADGNHGIYPDIKNSIEFHCSYPYKNSITIFKELNKN